MAESTTEFEEMKRQLAELKAMMAQGGQNPIFGGPNEVTRFNRGLNREPVDESPVLDEKGWKRMREVVPQVRKALNEGAQGFDQLEDGGQKLNGQVMALMMVLISKGVL